MVESILTALIAGGLALIGTVITVAAASRKTEQHIKTHQAVTDEKITELTREVREHNNFARRMPVVEEKIKNIEKALMLLHQERLQIYLLYQNT